MKNSLSVAPVGFRTFRIRSCRLTMLCDIGRKDLGNSTRAKYETNLMHGRDCHGRFWKG